MHGQCLYSDMEQECYSGKSELKDTDRKSMKTKTMYGVLQRKSDVDRLYIKRKEGGKSLVSLEHCVREEENSLGFHFANSEENSSGELLQLRQSILKIL